MSRLPDPYSSITPESAEESDDSDGTPATSTRPLAGKTVVLDPGHNGGNTATPQAVKQIDRKVTAAGLERRCDSAGAVDNGADESAAMFDLSGQVAQLLEDRGATVLLTRGDNEGVGPCVDQRIAMANREEAELFVSLHADAVPSTDARGFHVIYPAPVVGKTDDIHAASLDAAKAMASRLESDGPLPIANYIGGTGTDPRDDLIVLLAADVPAIVLELGNPSNRDDARILRRERAREGLAVVLADGIADYLTRQ